jgi:hypothetical protein
MINNVFKTVAWSAVSPASQSHMNKGGTQVTKIYLKREARISAFLNNGEFPRKL